MEKFNSSFKGYNIKEVNKFVDDTLKEFEALYAKLKTQDVELSNLRGELEHYKSLANKPSSIEITSESAQIKDLARREARMIIEDAKRNASRIVNDALIEAERTELHAEQLRRNMIVFKRRIKAALQTQMQSIEDLDEIKLEE